MKKKYLVSLLLSFFFSTVNFGQAGKFIGAWEGKLNVGIELRIIFHITEDGKGGLVAAADSPDQAAYGLKCDATTTFNNEVTITMTELKASFNGRLVNDSTIEGSFIQQTAIPLKLKKIEKIIERKRPQTPQPPFQYKSEDVEYYNADKSLKYGATITIPEGNGPFPAAVMITGSGAQDRNETFFDHKLFAVIADHLTLKGFIVLRVDDRGVGKSTGKFAVATTEDFAKDVSSSIDYLISRTKVDKKKVGLIGHSEGGMIAPMVAVKRKDINFIVLMAGPGVNIIDLMAEQNAAIVKSQGVSEETFKEIRPLFKEAAATIMEASDTITAIKNLTTFTEKWSTNKSKVVLKELNFETAKQRSDYINQMVKQFQSPWLRYFIRFRPSQYLKQLKCKVLALNGDKDIQVISSQNLPGIEAALKKSKSKVYQIKELPGLNHLFQYCNKCTVNEYGELEETISPHVLNIVSNWLEKNVN
ncbi:MAG: alpha/beta fold hydrolase [Chitinophagaceae bacterium]